MSYPRSPPQSPDDWKSQSIKSKTFSTSSSRSTNYNSRSASMASSSSRPYNNVNYESSARTYYVELRKYLKGFLAKEAAEGVHPQRASARQKLSRLSNLQFHELAMDVYDELMRRNLNDKFVPFLAVREEFHPKRNQARQKLATLPDPRFMDLASDVYYELTRRYPHIMDANDTNRPPMPPIPATSTSSSLPRHPMANGQQKPPASQSTTIVPMKGTINVEPVSSKDSSDEEDEDGHTQYSENSPVGKYTPSTHQQPYQRDRHTDNATTITSTNESNGYQRKQSLTPQSTTSSSAPSYYQQKGNGKAEGESLDSLMADLGNMVLSRSQESDNSNTAYNMRTNGNVDKRSDDDHRIASLTKRIQMLEKENQNLLARNQSRDGTENGSMDQMAKLQDEYQRLDEQFRTLERNHRDQQEIVRNVKQETSQLMDELEKLSNENDKLRKEKDQSDTQNRQLAQEIQEWQTKYQKLRMELRNTKGSTDEENAYPSQVIIKNNFLQPTRSGIISYDSIISYQAAVEDLLQKARSKTPSDVLASMKTIVMTCKSITEDVERYESKGALTLDKQTKLQSLKGPFSNELAHLVTAAKSHVNSMGISPVGLLDVAASNLTSAVVDLVQLVGMVSLTSDDRNTDYRTGSPQQPPTTSTSRDLRRQDSSGSSISVKKSNGTGPNTMMNTTSTSRTPTQLADYLKKETDQIVTSIQSLLSALRSTQKIGDVYGIITTIADVVTTVTDASKDTFSTNAAGLRYRQQGDVILSDLQACRDKLIHIRNTSFARSPETASSTAKRDLAKESYEIAKFIKELIGLCES
ncbi:hypothetical protein BC941DRAFT_512161 [Chlamydoabsidia padenii]|nr:hypothetical protein BC941DRAFT_512161 [Chlamydoabsidia padenii]